MRCVALPDCTAVPRVPGLLGVDSTPRKRRSLSVSDLRAYKDCPERYHAVRVLKLRDGRTENAAIRRGRAVDAWLNDRHAGPFPHLLSICLPPRRAAWTRGQRTARSPRHAPTAPSTLPARRAGGPRAVQPQRRVVAYDPQADVVLVADCDLVHTDRGGVVVRETKTTTSDYTDPGGLMRQYPQLALAVLLVEHGVLGGDTLRSRVELEVLRPDGVRLELLDPHDPRTAARARAELRDLAADWAADRVYRAAPSPRTDCGTCEVSRWCSTSRERSDTQGGAA